MAVNTKTDLLRYDTMQSGTCSPTFQRNTLKSSSEHLTVIYMVRKLLRLRGQSFHFRISSKPKSQLPSESTVQYIIATVSGLQCSKYRRRQFIKEEIMPRSVLLISITVHLLLFFLASIHIKNKSNEEFDTQQSICVIIMQIPTSDTHIS